MTELDETDRNVEVDYQHDNRLITHYHMSAVAQRQPYLVVVGMQLLLLHQHRHAMWHVLEAACL